MLIRIAIADSDNEYIDRLTNVLETYDDVSLSIYTDRYALETALMTKSFDVLLFSPELFDVQLCFWMRKSQFRNLVFLLQRCVNISGLV